MDGAIDKLKSLFDFSEYRNEWSAFGSGLLFFMGWWIIFDISAHYTSQTEFNHTFYICGVLATIALIMINTVTNEQINGGVYTDGCCGTQTARLWLFSGFILSFISLISSIWILFQYYVTDKDKDHKYPGVALFLQNAMIFGSSLLLKYGRSEDI